MQQLKQQTAFKRFSKRASRAVFGAALCLVLGACSQTGTTPATTATTSGQDDPQALAVLVPGFSSGILRSGPATVLGVLLS